MKAKKKNLQFDCGKNLLALRNEITFLGRFQKCLMLSLSFQNNDWQMLCFSCYFIILHYFSCILTYRQALLLKIKQNKAYFHENNCMGSIKHTPKTTIQH